MNKDLIEKGVQSVIEMETAGPREEVNKEVHASVLYQVPIDDVFDWDKAGD